MARKYTLRRRAEQQAETRRRIVEAAVRLHSSIGPVQTTFTRLAEAAGVQRHTLYAHFPDERSLFHACTAHHLEEDPLPDASQWGEIRDDAERLRTGLGQVYAWYERNESLTAHVMRDVEVDAVLSEVTDLRMGPHFAAWEKALGADRGNSARAAMVQLALSFFTWRTLARVRGLGSAATVELMVAAILSAADD